MSGSAPARGAVLVAALLAAVAGRHMPAAASGRVVGFAASDGVALSAMIYEASTRPAPGVVLVHMLGRSKDEWAALADRLQDAGLTVLAVDLRGHGSSGGNGDQLSLMANDVRAAVDWLAARPAVRPGAIAILGASLGANLAVQAAADRPVVRALALVSPSLDYRGVRLDAALLAKVAGRAFWLTAGTDDAYALRTVKELSQGASPREQRLSSGKSHGTGLFTADPDLAPALVDWLRRTLIF